MLVVIMCIVTVVSTAITIVLNKEEVDEKKDEIVIVTSFYPVYIATLNVVNGIDGVKVVNLMEQQGGCLHDYQLTTNDMKKLEQADVFIMNGAGMEGYVSTIVDAYPNLEVVDSSEGVSLLTIEGEIHSHEEDADHTHSHEEDADHAHTEEEEEHSHDHGDYNSHIWLNPNNYVKQVETIMTALTKIDETHGVLYKANAENYIAKVEGLIEEMNGLENPVNQEVVLFHDSMEYLLQPLGIEVAYSLGIDEENTLSAGEVATVIDEVRNHGIQVLFSEVQFEQSMADRIAEETGASVVVLDSLVSGEVSLDAYIEGMKKNLETIKEVLY